MKLQFLLILLILGTASPQAAQSRRGVYLIVESNPQGTMIAAVGTEGVAQILDAGNGNLLADISLDDPIAIWTVGWRPDGKRLALADVGGTIRIYCADVSISSDCGFGDLLGSWDSPTLDVLDLDWSPDGSKIATASQDTARSIIVWDANTHQLLGYTGGLDPMDVDWSSDGRWIAFANVDLGVGYIDVDTLLDDNKGHAPILQPGTIRDATAAAWNHASTQLAIAEGSAAHPDDVPIAISIWDVNQGRLVITMTGHTRTIEGLAWSQDDAYLASVGFDQQVIVWDVAAGRIVNRYQGPEAGLISIYGVTWIGATHQIAFGGAPSIAPTIKDALNRGGTESTPQPVSTGETGYSAGAGSTASPSRETFFFLPPAS